MTQTITLADRASHVRPRPGRLASVALPVLRSRRGGLVLAVTQRSRINGHTGAPISHAGEVVLFGGSRNPGESGEDAALRELREESGIPPARAASHRVVEHVGSWVTERGYAAEGYLVAVRPSFAADIVPDAREVARVAFLPRPPLPDDPAARAAHGLAARLNLNLDAWGGHGAPPDRRLAANRPQCCRWMPPAIRAAWRVSPRRRRCRALRRPPRCPSRFGRRGSLTSRPRSGRARRPSANRRP